MSDASVLPEVAGGARAPTSPQVAAARRRLASITAWIGTGGGTNPAETSTKPPDLKQGAEVVAERRDGAQAGLGARRGLVGGAVERRLDRDVLGVAFDCEPPWPALDVDKAIPWLEGRGGLTLAPSQREALRLAVASKALVITGGPGVGKTTLENLILKVLIAKSVNVALCAPTGRAAKRLCWRRMPRPIAVNPTDQRAPSAIIQVAVFMFVSKLALLVGSSVPALIASGWALASQELGHFLGTALLGMPFALLLGIKREAVGATFSVGREPSLAIISERYGLNSPEGRGVMAEYVTGTVVGAILISLIASLIASTGVFNPLALAMGAGVGSGSTMAAASGAIAAQQAPDMAKQVAAFAAASNLITTTVGTYFTLFLSLPFSNFLYRTLEPVIGRFARARVAPRSETVEDDVAVTEGASHDETIGLPVLSGLLVLVGAMALVLGNWITYHMLPTAALVGMAVVVALAIVGEVVRRVVPSRVPSVFWITAIGMALTAPYWSGAAWFAAQTANMNFLALSTPLLAYAGLSLAKDLPTFKVLDRRIVVVSSIMEQTQEAPVLWSIHM